MDQPFPLNTVGIGGGDQEGEGEQEGGREAFRAFGAAIFLNCSSTISFSLRVKARVLSGSYIICPPH